MPLAPMSPAGPYASGATAPAKPSAPVVNVPAAKPAATTPVAKPITPPPAAKPTPAKPAAFQSPVKTSPKETTAQRRPISVDEAKASGVETAPTTGDDFDDMFANPLKSQQTGEEVQDDDSTATDDTEVVEDVTKKPDDEVSFDVKDGDDDKDLSKDDNQPTGDEKSRFPKRDYSKYDPELKSILSELPNGKFKQFADKIAEWHKTAKEAGELKTKFEALTQEKPRFLAEHPESYRLAPEYKAARLNYQAAKLESRHWEQQLINIQNGEAWREFTGYDDNGNAQFQDHPASADGRVDQRAAIAVQRALAMSAAEEKNQRDALSNIANNYGSYQQQSITQLKDITEKLFKTTPDKLTGDDAKHYKTAIDMLPGPFSDNPLAPLIGLTHVSFRKLVTRMQAMDKELKALKGGGAAKAAPTVGPRGKAGGAVANNGGNMLSWDELDPSKY